MIVYSSEDFSELCIIKNKEFLLCDDIAISDDLTKIASCVKGGFNPLSNFKIYDVKNNKFITQDILTMPYIITYDTEKNEIKKYEGTDYQYDRVIYQKEYMDVFCFVNDDENIVHWRSFNDLQKVDEYTMQSSLDQYIFMYDFTDGYYKVIPNTPYYMGIDHNSFIIKTENEIIDRINILINEAMLNCDFSLCVYNGNNATNFFKILYQNGGKVPKEYIPKPLNVPFE